MDDLDTTPRRDAPTRQEINLMDSVSALNELIAEATDVEIAIKTQLEYWADDDVMKGRRIGALVYWRQAIKNARHRIYAIRAELKGTVVNA